MAASEFFSALMLTGSSSSSSLCPSADAVTSSANRLVSFEVPGSFSLPPTRSAAAERKLDYHLRWDQWQRDGTSGSIRGRGLILNPHPISSHTPSSHSQLEYLPSLPVGALKRRQGPPTPLLLPSSSSLLRCPSAIVPVPSSSSLLPPFCFSSRLILISHQETCGERPRGCSDAQ